MKSRKKITRVFKIENPDQVITRYPYQDAMEFYFPSTGESKLFQGIFYSTYTDIGDSILITRRAPALFSNIYILLSACLSDIDSLPSQNDRDSTQYFKISRDGELSYYSEEVWRGIDSTINATKARQEADPEFHRFFIRENKELSEESRSTIRVVNTLERSPVEVDLHEMTQVSGATIVRDVLGTFWCVERYTSWELI